MTCTHIGSTRVRDELTCHFIISIGNIYFSSRGIGLQ